MSRELETHERRRTDLTASHPRDAEPTKTAVLAEAGISKNTAALELPMGGLAELIRWRQDTVPPSASVSMPDDNEWESHRAKVKKLNAQRRQLADRIVKLAAELRVANNEYHRVAHGMEGLRRKAKLPDGLMRPWDLNLDSSPEHKLIFTKRFSDHEKQVQQMLGRALQAEPRD